jgi:hypothetical protein
MSKVIMLYGCYESEVCVQVIRGVFIPPIMLQKNYPIQNIFQLFGVMNEPQIS